MEFACPEGGFDFSRALRPSAAL